LNHTSVSYASSEVTTQWLLVIMRLAGPSRHPVHNSVPLMSSRATALERLYATGSADL
jgi:hypothetical protein